jgi:YHS domain-containing protein
MLAASVFLLGTVVQASAWADGPPHGPRDQAFCPVTGVRLNISSATPSVEFTHGQKLYFGTPDAAAAYRAAPKNYWLAPTDSPLPPPDGMRGLPDLRDETVMCPGSGEELHVSMQTLRVVQKHGQAVYFCCNGCMMSFWTDPTKFLVSPSDPVILL